MTSLYHAIVGFDVEDDRILVGTTKVIASSARDARERAIHLLFDGRLRTSGARPFAIVKRLRALRRV